MNNWIFMGVATVNLKLHYTNTTNAELQILWASLLSSTQALASLSIFSYYIIQLATLVHVPIHVTV